MDTVGFVVGHNQVFTVAILSSHNTIRSLLRYWSPSPFISLASVRFARSKLCTRSYIRCLTAITDTKIHANIMLWILPPPPIWPTTDRQSVKWKLWVKVLVASYECSIACKLNVNKNTWRDLSLLSIWPEKVIITRSQKTKDGTSWPPIHASFHLYNRTCGSIGKGQRKAAVGRICFTYMIADSTKLRRQGMTVCVRSLSLIFYGTVPAGCAFSNYLLWYVRREQTMWREG